MPLSPINIRQTGSTKNFFSDCKRNSYNSISSFTFLKPCFPFDANAVLWVSDKALKKISEHKKVPGEAFDAMRDVRLSDDPKKLLFLFNKVPVCNPPCNCRKLAFSQMFFNNKT